MEYITKNDLSEFKIALLDELQKMMVEKSETEHKNEVEKEWLRSKAVRKLLEISPATLQNLRITGKVRHKKVMGSYYYNHKDILKLFK